jgi:hypothetical protein
LYNLIFLSGIPFDPERAGIIAIIFIFIYLCFLDFNIIFLFNNNCLVIFEIYLLVIIFSNIICKNIEIYNNI